MFYNYYYDYFLLFVRRLTFSFLHLVHAHILATFFWILVLVEFFVWNPGLDIQKNCSPSYYNLWPFVSILCAQISFWRERIYIFWTEMSILKEHNCLLREQVNILWPEIILSLSFCGHKLAYYGHKIAFCLHFVGTN